MMVINALISIIYYLGLFAVLAFTAMFGFLAFVDCFSGMYIYAALDLIMCIVLSASLVFGLDS